MQGGAHMHAFIVFHIVMQAGFAFLESGAVRAGKEKPVLFKNFLVLCVGNLAFWATGFAFGYGGTNPFIGDRYFFLINLGQNNYVLWLSNFVFAATTSTIATGALAERAKLVSYLVLSFFIAGATFPPCSNLICSVFLLQDSFILLWLTGRGRKTAG